MPFGGLLTAGLISGGSSIIGGLLGSHGANSAADKQANAAAGANNVLKSASDNANITAGNVLGQQTGTEAPFYNNGAYAINELTGALAPGGALNNTPAFSFNPGDLTQDPGYQFDRQQGDAALQRNAAATGELGGNAAIAAEQFGTGLADNTYNNAFQRSLSTYNTNLSSQTALYQKLLGVSQLGQTAAANDNASLSGYGQAVESNELGTAQEQGNNITGAGNALAAGTVGATNAWTGALSNTSSMASQLALLSNSSYGKSSSGSSFAGIGNTGGYSGE